MIYLDAASTTMPTSDAIKRATKCMHSEWCNPSSLYHLSKEIKNNIEEVRCKVAKSINAEPQEIIFTSGGCESNSMALQGLLNSSKTEVTNVITSKLEHTSINRLLDDYSDKVNVIKLKNNSKGEIDLLDLISVLDDLDKDKENVHKTLVSIQFANNEIGTIQDIKTISELIHMNGKNFIFHTDAVQAYGHINIDVKELNIDMLSASGHKIGCPKGVGFLYIREDIQKYIKPLIYGSQEFGLRGGTENTSCIMALGTVIDYLNYDNKELIKKRKYFETKLINIGFEINGSDNKLPNNISATYTPPYVFNNESLIYLLDMFGIYISSGSACNSNYIKPSLVLQNIDLTDEQISRTIRITMPTDISIEDIDYVIEVMKKQITNMQTNAFEISN